jgi:hypothetical protein
MSSTDAKLDALIEELKRDRKRGSSSGGGGDTESKLDMTIDGIKKAGSVMFTSAEALKKNVAESADMYQNLSKAGMNFSGDLFAMSNAAVGMRMSTKEMEESFLSFQKDGILKGFGTNITASAEGFAKASKSFFDNNSQAADDLRRMGFTAKDINEVLALQGVTLRGKFKDDQEMASIAANNAMKLATEMDSLSKLTGKSRAEQAEMMKKQQADMQFEAAIRLKTQGMSAEEAAKFEANARQQLHEAQVLGQGQMFKEIFATGQIMSKEAATQAAINREQATAAKKMAETAADKTLNEEERERRGAAARNELMGAAARDLNDKTKLQAATFGDVGGAYSKVILDNMGKQIDYSRVLEKVAAERGLDLKKEGDAAKAAEIARREIKEAQAGQKKTGVDQKEQVDASSKALAGLTGRIGDVQSVLNEKFVQPLQGQVNKALEGLANTAFRADGTLGGLIKDRPGMEKATVAQKAKSEIDIGGNAGFKEADGFLQSAGAVNKATHKLIDETIPAVKKVAEAAVEKVKQLAETQPKGSRSQGSLTMTGSMLENFGAGTPMMLHGMEAIMTPKDINSLVQNTLEGAMKAVPKSGVMDTTQLSKLDELKKSAISAGAPKTSGNDLDEQKRAAIMAGAPKTGNIDLKKMGETVNANISSSYRDKVDMKSLKFDQFGMPITSQIKERAAEIPTEIKKKEEEKKAASTTQPSAPATPPATTAAKPEEKKPDAAKPPAATGKESTLNDVVVALNQLNTKVTTLIDVQKDLGQRQIKATKANGKDVYAS